MLSHLNSSRSKKKPIIYLAIGGSSTNDAGMGMATALGYRFLDHKGNPLDGMGKNLGEVRKIIPGEHPMAAKLKILCDVRNPLFGPNGSAYCYATQKGANPSEVRHLDRGLRYFAKVVQNDLGVGNPNAPGAGAAGGLGFGCASFLGAELLSGVETFFDWTDFRNSVRKSDCVLTGEGCFDSTSLDGKVVGSVMRVCQEENTPCIVLAGSMTPKVCEHLPEKKYFQFYSMYPVWKKPDIQRISQSQHFRVLETLSRNAAFLWFQSHLKT